MLNYRLGTVNEKLEKSYNVLYTVGRGTVVNQPNNLTWAVGQEEWIVPQFLDLRPKMAKSIVYVITLITNRNHAFHCLN